MPYCDSSCGITAAAISVAVIVIISADDIVVNREFETFANFLNRRIYLDCVKKM